MSEVEILYDVGGSPQDITDSVLFAKTSFTQSMNAVPGDFSITVRDPERILSFSTGREIRLTIDGIVMFGGYVTQVSMGSMADAADVDPVEEYELRTWTLRGTDYNVIFDKRVIRNTDDYFSQIEIPITTDGAMVTTLIEDYTDCSDFSTAGINSSATAPGSGNDFLQQGTKLRDPVNQYSFWGGCIYYIDGSKTFIYVPFEDVEKRWGFSDDPNHNPITVSPDEYQGATTGFRQVEGVEDGTFIVNDALIWGGSQFGGVGGGTAFARVEDATSQSTYGRWQVAETHFGEKYYNATGHITDFTGTVTKTATSVTIVGSGTSFLSQLTVGLIVSIPGGAHTETFTVASIADNTHFDATAPADFSASGQSFYVANGTETRANVIVYGPPGTDVRGQQKGLRYTQWQFTFTWISANVPLLSGVPDHLRPGDIVTIDLTAFGVTKLLPLSSLRTSFPDAFDEDGTHLVQFDGTFGLQLSDPFTLWRYLLNAQARISTTVTTVANAVNDDSTQTTYGASGQFTPTPATDGVETVFSLPFGYLPGSLLVYMNGLQQRPGIDYTKSDNVAGEFTMTTAPDAIDELYAITCLTLES